MITLTSSTPEEKETTMTRVRTSARALASLAVAIQVGTNLRGKEDTGSPMGTYKYYYIENV